MTEKLPIDHFAQLEITIGRVEEAERVPNTDKLIRLDVDVGEGTTRQIVSGIAPYLEDVRWLVGQKFPFVTNLEPKTFKGLESNGMILAVQSEEGAFSFLQLTTDLPVGSRVR
jgi:methionyl-tRNA synthetase